MRHVVVDVEDYTGQLVLNFMSWVLIRKLTVMLILTKILIDA